MQLTLNPKVRRNAAAAGLLELAQEGVGFHDFRGTFAEQALLQLIALYQENGLDRVRAEEAAVRCVQRMLGHANSTTTYRYLKFRQERATLFNANNQYASALFGVDE